MTAADALKLAARLFPRGTLTCDEDHRRAEHQRFRVIHEGKVRGEGPTWAAAIAAARNRTPEQEALPL